jgi:AraC-like DNA-binding protein
MARATDPNIPQIVYSATTKKVFEGELFIRQHVFDYILSGTSDVSFNGKTHTFHAGDLRFAVRNRLSQFSKQPEPGGLYKSISICIDTPTLRELGKGYTVKSTARPPDNVFKLSPHRMFTNYMDSLLPYLEHESSISNTLLQTKVREAVLIFTEANPMLKDILYDFSEPGKVDLEAYMQEHYRYNGDMKYFAYLTGRSLSTFKRDFEKTFHTTPNKWLLQKRLEEAHYLLQKKKAKATEVYVDVGFKDYSHFSVSFKKAFGVAPSSL